MKNTLLVVTCAIVLLGAANRLWAQDSLLDAYSFETAVAKSKQDLAKDSAAITKSRDELAAENRKHERTTALYEILVISFIALMSLIVVLWFITRSPTHSASDIVHATGLIFIIYATVFLSMIASTDQQLTAPMGILGAVAGYLFGQLKGAAK
jgi:drug/metabolite transporter superfamily protein YnfA